MKETKVASFTWTLDNVPNVLAEQSDSNEPITSQLFTFHGDRWRGVITPQLDMFVQLVSSVNTVTAEIRYERIKQSPKWCKMVPKFVSNCLFTYLEPCELFLGIS